VIAERRISLREMVGEFAVNNLAKSMRELIGFDFETKFSVSTITLLL